VTPGPAVQFPCKVRVRVTVNTKNLSYEECLKMLNLPILKYQRVQGDMIELYKIITHELLLLLVFCCFTAGH